MPEERIQVQVLGPVRACRGEHEFPLGGGRRAAVLGLLALACGQPMSRADLVDALWGERPPPTAPNVIQTYVSYLRRLLEPGRQPRGRSTVVVSVGDGYALGSAVVDIDLVQFRRLVGTAAALQDRGEQQRAAATLSEALAQWRGSALADLPFLAAHPLVAAADAERRAAVASYGELMIACGAPADALPLLAETAAVHPLDEAAQGRLIRAYHAAGRLGDAFAAYEQTRRRLAEDLGVDPGPDLAAAHRALLHHGTGPPPGPAHSPAGAVAAPATPPARTAAPAARPVPAQLPADVAGFTGRAAELAELDGLLGPASGGAPPSGDPPAGGGPASGDPPAGGAPPSGGGPAGGGPADASPGSTAALIAVVSGTAGVGKTALALRWAHLARRRFPHGQLYVDLRGYDPDQPVAAADVLARFLVALGVADRDIPAEADARADRYRTEITGRRMLVVLDNASSVEQVRPLLPGTPTAAVIVTSRDSLAGLVALHGARRVDLDVLPLPDAIMLLRRIIGNRADAEPEAAALLAGRCARLPLALRVAAELAGSRPNTPMSALAEELSDLQWRLDQLDGGDDPRAGVGTVFSWSYRQLGADAARMFRRLGLHPGADLDVLAAAALAGSTVGEAQRLLRLLERAHLVRAAPKRRYALHDLLRAYAAAQVAVEDSEEERNTALDRLFDHYLDSTVAAVQTVHPAVRVSGPRGRQRASVGPPFPDREAAVGWLDDELPTLVTVAGYTADHGWPAHAVHLSAVLRYHLLSAHHADAVAIHGNAQRAAQRLRDRAGEADALQGLAAAYSRLERYEVAAEYLERALALYRQAGSAAGQAGALVDLGRIDLELGRYRSAADHLAQALVLGRSSGDQVAEAAALRLLGVVDWVNGRAGAATDRIDQSLAISRQLGDRFGEALALHNLGLIEQSRGEHELAAGHHRETLALVRQLGNRIGEALALGNLGRTEQRLGAYQQAADHHRLALALFRQLGNRVGEAIALDGLGQTQLGLGHLDQAVRHLEQALDRHQDSGDACGQASALNGLGEVARAAGRPEAAIVHHGAALTRCRLHIAASEDIDNRYQQARAHVGLADARHVLGDPALSRRHYQHALTLTADLRHPDVEQVRAQLGQLADVSDRLLK